VALQSSRALSLAQENIDKAMRFLDSPLLRRVHEDHKGGLSPQPPLSATEPGLVISILEERILEEVSRIPRDSYVLRDALCESGTHSAALLSVIFTRRLAIPGSSCLNEGSGGSEVER